MRKIRALILYYKAEDNKTLSYQTEWPEAFKKNLFDSRLINLNDLNQRIFQNYYFICLTKELK